MTMFTFPGQGWQQLEELLLAFVLSSIVGLEREMRQKAAGLRTYTLVGVSAALFMLVSKYGFTDVLSGGRVVLDPSRVAAQVVSGIGFIGGGVIFMRRDVVRGLTTAASVWLTAALGMTCGAGLPILALATTVGHIVIMFVFPKLTRWLPRDARVATRLRLSYQDGRGLLRTILVTCSSLRFAIDHVAVERGVHDASFDDRDRAEIAQGGGSHRGVVGLSMQVKGKRPIAHLVAALLDIDGVVAVSSAADEAELD